MLVHLCLSVLLSLMSLTHCYNYFELINDDDNDDDDEELRN